MRIKAFHIAVFFIFLLAPFANGQNRFNLSKEKSSKIRFQLINNIIIIPVELNGIELSFVLDTGVSRPILFNIVNMDSLQMRNTETIFLRGLGSEGNIEAVKSKGNIIRVGDAVAVNRDVFVVFDPTINFTPRLGVNVHGIIGYDLFKDFVIEINYTSKFIRLHHPSFFKPKTSSKWKTIPIELYKNKPYLNANVTLGTNSIPVKLLIDSGGSDALWLFEDENITAPETMFFNDFLGKGLSGAVYGKRSKVKSFGLNKFELDGVNVAFPDSASITIARNFKERNGSIAGNVLKRFNMFIDYKHKNIQLKKNRLFKQRFNYNNSGIVLEQNGLRVVKEQKKPNFNTPSPGVNNDLNTIDFLIRYKYSLKPAYTIVKLRETSNAKAAGLQIDDVIITVNGKPTHSMELQQVNQYLFDKEGSVIRLGVDRDGKKLFFQFKLDDVFNQKNESSK